LPRRFKGVLFKIGRASWRAPVGSRNHRVVLNREVVQQSISQLVGLPVWDCDPISKGHQCSRKIGKIEKAFIDGIKVCIEGYMIEDSIFNMQASASSGNLGLSFDTINAHVKSINSLVYEIIKVEFIGVTVLPQNRGAFGTDTSFHVIGEG